MSDPADLERRYRRLLKCFSARRHPLLIIRMRIAIGIWLLVLGAILVGGGYWWGALMVAPAALHFYFAHRLRQAVQS